MAECTEGWGGVSMGGTGWKKFVREKDEDDLWPRGNIGKKVTS